MRSCLIVEETTQFSVSSVQLPRSSSPVWGRRLRRRRARRCSVAGLSAGMAIGMVSDADDIFGEMDSLEKDVVSSLLGASESFRDSTVQLSIVCGATANIMNLKGAICSAVDVLQAMASSICFLMSEVEKVNALLDEVLSIATSEHALLDECKDLLSALECKK